METLLNFVQKYNYNLLDHITFNSYRTGQRSEVREYDSISVTEILSLIEDPSMEFVKRYYSDKLKASQDHGISTHSVIESSIKGKLDPSIPLTPIVSGTLIQYRLCILKENITDLQAEVFLKKEYKDLPLVTGKVDAIGKINSISGTIDWKTSKTNRNFKSVKYWIQMAGYRWLSGMQKSYIAYLNDKNYQLIEGINNHYYDTIWLDLLEYANSLYEKGAFKNLHSKI